MGKLLFDLTAVRASGSAKFHGGSEYAKFVFFELQKKKLSMDLLIFADQDLSEQIKNSIELNDNKIVMINTLTDINQIMEKNHYEKFYSAMPYDYGHLNFRETEFIYTIHGLRELELESDKYVLEYAQSFSKKMKTLVKRILFKHRDSKSLYKRIDDLTKQKKKKIITVSNHSKYSILSFFPDISDDQINVFYAPINLAEAKGLDKKKQFLLVSANRWTKNTYRAVKALDNLFDRPELKEYRVAVTGVGNEKYFRNLKNGNHFDLYGYVEKEKLDTLFEESAFFLYPTLNEGFGYPPLEAMNKGSVCLASSHSSVPEVCGDAVIYFNPLSIKEIQSRILFAISKDFDNSLYAVKGRERVEYIKQLQEKMMSEMLELF